MTKNNAEPVSVYGSSDDLIEVEGAIREEFEALGEDDGVLLVFSTGVVLRVAYSNQGVWRITPVAGSELVSIVQAPEDDEDNYSDRAHLLGNPAWVVCGNVFVKAKTPVLDG